MDVMISGKVAMVCGYGDVGKGSANSLQRKSPSDGFEVDLSNAFSLYDTVE